MPSETGVVKGQIKEAAGAMTGKDELRTEGKSDQAVGKVRQVAEKTVDQIVQAATNVRQSSCRNPRTVLGMVMGDCSIVLTKWRDDYGYSWVDHPDYRVNRAVRWGWLLLDPPQIVKGRQVRLTGKITTPVTVLGPVL